MGRYFKPNETVRDRDNTVTGVVVTGNEQPCQMESCGGVRTAVRWPNGELRYLCSKGLTAGTSTTYRLL